MKKKIIFLILFCLAICSGCISEYASDNHAIDEKPGNLTPDPDLTAQANPDFEQCAHDEVSGLEDTYIEFLPGETQKTINYTFSNTLESPTEISYTLVPVNNWGERDPVVFPDWVNVSIEPSLLINPPCRSETSKVRIRLTQNATGTSASSLPVSRTAFFYLKPITNSSIHTDAEDWLCIQENYNYRTLLRPRLKASMEHADLVVHPGSGTQTSLIINTQSQGVDSVQFEILAEDIISADILEEGLLQVKLEPPMFSTRSFRQYTTVLLINASDRLPSGTYRFIIVIHSKSLAKLHIRIEAGTFSPFHDTYAPAEQHERYDELYTFGLDYNAHSNYERALDCFNRSLQIDPYSAEVWGARGVTLFNMKRLNEANESADKALQIDPEIPFAPRLKEEIALAMEKEGG